MPNQNECDHIVGLSFRLVHRNHIKDGCDWVSTKFDYCPNCGAKIDWVKIKEELDDK